MNEQEMKGIMFVNVDMITEGLTNLELAMLNIVSQLNEDPHGRLFDYDKVSPLFTENKEKRMHKETKTALAAVVNRRLG